MSSSAASKQIMSVVEEEKSESQGPEVSFSSETSTHASRSGRGKNKSKEHDPLAFRRNKVKFTCFILTLGSLVSAAFIAMGTITAKQNSEIQFVQRTQEITFHVEAAWAMYYMFAKWARESCSRPYDPLYIEEGLSTLEMGDDPSHHLGFCNHEEFNKVNTRACADVKLFKHENVS